MDLTLLPGYITAVGALGASATGLVDTTKVFNGGLSRAGYRTIVGQLQPFKPMLDAIPHGCAWETIYAIWINGVALDDQKAKVKALIMLGSGAGTAPAMARATGIAETDLTTMTAGDPVAARLEAVLSAILDGTYEQADQHYRNAAKAAAALIAVLLSAIGFTATFGFSFTLMIKATLIGLVATPLAPVVKDLTSAINNAAQTAQQLGRAVVVKTG